MHGANGVVEFPQEIIRIIERAVSVYVDLSGLQNPDTNQMPIQFVDEANLLPQIFDGNTSRDL